jgi:hypothetical protein
MDDFRARERNIQDEFRKDSFQKQSTQNKTNKKQQ